MKLHIITIVLDGLPFLQAQLATLNRLHYSVDWTWHIVEGVAENTGSTVWCKPMYPRLSVDGSADWLFSVACHPRIRTYRKTLWVGGKDTMVNWPLRQITEPGTLLEIDADEFWTAAQIERICTLVDGVHHDHAYFYCRYFVGQNIITTGHNSYGNNPGEWLRAWYYQPGMTFKTHEPPFLEGAHKKPMDRDTTMLSGLVFDHYAYVLPQQVRFKEAFYGYQNATTRWAQLQANTKWPVKLKDFLPWVDGRATANLLHNTNPRNEPHPNNVRPQE